MDEKIKSSVNDANMRSLAGLLKEILRFHDISFETCAPARVFEVKEDAHEVVVELLNRFAYQSEEGIVYKDVEKITIPLYRQQQGGFIINMPVQKGDTGWVFASSRDPQNAIEENSKLVGGSEGENKGPQDLKTLEMHKYSLGFFLPAKWGKLKLDDGDKKELFLFGNVKEDGDSTAYFSVSKDGELKVKSLDGKIYLDGAEIYLKNSEGELCKVSIDGELDVTKDSEFHKNLSVDEDLTVGGNLSVGGNQEVKGTSTLGEVFIGEDKATLVETEIVTDYDSENKRFNTWKGKVLRTEGEVGTPIPASTIVEGGGGGGGGGNFVTIDTEQTVTGSKTFSTAVNVSNNVGSAVYDSGKIELYRGTPYIDFHFGQSTEDYTSRIIDSSNSLNIQARDKNIILFCQENGARLQNPPDGTEDAAIATVGWTNSQKADKSTVNKTKFQMVTGMVYSTSNHTFKRKYVEVTIVNGVITEISEEKTDNDNPIFTATQHESEMG